MITIETHTAHPQSTRASPLCLAHHPRRHTHLCPREDSSFAESSFGPMSFLHADWTKWVEVLVKAKCPGLFGGSVHLYRLQSICFYRRMNCLGTHNLIPRFINPRLPLPPLWRCVCSPALLFRGLGHHMHQSSAEATFYLPRLTHTILIPPLLSSSTAFMPTVGCASPATTATHAASHAAAILKVTLPGPRCMGRPWCPLAR